MRGATVTALPLSALMGSVALGPEGPALLDHALQKRVSLEQVRAAYYRNIGFAGNERAGELLRAAADKSAAASERIFIKLLKDAGIRGWRVNYCWDPADRRSIDMSRSSGSGWPSRSTGGPGITRRTGSSATGPSRTTSTDLGWTVLRFTWFDLTQNPAEVVRRVRAQLAAAA